MEETNEQKKARYTGQYIQQLKDSNNSIWKKLGQLAAEILPKKKESELLLSLLIQCIDDRDELYKQLQEAMATKVKSTGIDKIAAERVRQQTEERYTAEHDDQHDNDEFCIAAACYAIAHVPNVEVVRHYPVATVPAWPWDSFYFKPTTPQRNHEKAGALIAAAIDQELRENKDDGE